MLLEAAVAYVAESVSFVISAFQENLLQAHLAQLSVAFSFTSHPFHFMKKGLMRN